MSRSQASSSHWLSAPPRATYFCRHTGLVSGAVFAPDARHFASSSSFDNTVRIWDGVSREQLAVIVQENENLPAIAFSADSKRVALGGRKGKMISVRNTADGEEVIRLVGHTDAVYDIAFNPDGKTLASVSRDGAIKLWNLATTQELFTIQSHEWLGAVAFSPDGKLLASGGVSGAIQIWDTNTGQERVSLPDGRVRLLLFSPDGKTLCSVSDTYLRLWEVDTGAERACEQPDWLSHGDYIDALAFSPDSRTLVAGHENAIGLWDVATGVSTTAWFDDGITPYFRFPDRYLIRPDNLFLKLRSQCGPCLLAAAFKPNGDLMLLGEARNAVAMWWLTSVEQRK